MIKISTVAAIVVTVAAVIYSIPNVKDLLVAHENRKQVSSDQKIAVEKLESVDRELNRYKEKYEDISILSNLDLAKTIDSFEGCTFCSATSIAKIDSGLVDCAEVTNVDDVSFFSPSTAQIRFKLRLQNLDDFLHSISSSVVSAESVKIDTNDKNIFITVNSAFNEMEVVNE